MASTSRTESATELPDFEDELSDYEDFLVTITDLLESESNEETCKMCICGLPSLERVVICKEPSCLIKYFHQDCVGPVQLYTDWLCDTCKASTQSDNDRPTSVPSTSSVSGAHHSADDCEEVAGVQAPGEASAAPNTSIPSTQTGKMKYPKRRYGKDDASSRAEVYAKTAIDGIFTSPLFKMETVLVAKVKSLASSVQDSLGNADVVAFFQTITGKLWKRVASVVRGKAWTEDCKGQMWQAFQVLRTKRKLCGVWKSLLDKLEIRREEDEEIFLLQYLLEHIFKQLMHEMMQKDLPVIVQPMKEVTLDENEEQALRYCAGYIPTKLIKRYKKLKNNETAAAFVEVLQSWSERNVEDAPSFAEYTRLWLEKQDRGGLFLVTDSVYDFFKAMELDVSGSLQKENIDLFQNIDIQVALLNNLCRNADVSQRWEKLSGTLSSVRKEKLFQEVAKSFLKMRCEAFVKVYIMIRKQKEHEVSKKGERSLRKELAK